MHLCEIKGKLLVLTIHTSLRRAGCQVEGGSERALRELRTEAGR